MFARLLITTILQKRNTKDFTILLEVINRTGRETEYITKLFVKQRCVWIFE